MVVSGLLLCPFRKCLSIKLKYPPKMDKKLKKLSLIKKKTSYKVLIISLGMKNKGVCKHHAGLRIYNQKYYPVHFDADKGSWYVKKTKGGGCIVQCNQCIVIGTWS